MIRRNERGNAIIEVALMAPWIFFWFPVDLWATRPDVEGWRIPAVFNGQRWLEARVRP